MRHELSTGQAREIALLRQRHPRCEIAVHRKPWGVIVEASRNGQCLELLRADYYGRCDSAHDLPKAA
ncbi:MAG: hypothetical protein V9E83_01875 [Baekduia sp.]